MEWKVGCIQMDIAYGDPVQNFKIAEQWFKKAAKEKCTVVVLPELWTTGYDLTRLDEIAHEEGENVIHFLQAQAKKHSFHIVGGSVAKKTNEGVNNTMYIIDKEGKLIHEYSKLHLFQLMDEHLYLQAGEDETMFTIEGEEAASFICYDIRFPEWLRKPVLKGAKVLFVVAEWPEARVDHWRILLKARAIENQSYVIACNRVGKDTNNTFAGHSMIIDPWGAVISEGGIGEELVIGNISPDKIGEIRSRIPIFDDRRPKYY
ncbi:carbon-nitrogen family hydrolase [Lederbergia lenta]|uniref:Putative hydrolase n=1 Tax=Lederbergia lenta TaxID=1467 RepID=A0A2X4VTK9_LEDLE|nr:carbon-nitrogen family hydrolase [Lederbergia lenta]MCM3111032.1 carbon-nitrogen family hydrolase [Lederbergia lenta]MEC2325580.1 carbon-nitrogen family hydrolase [Lederbergia lenta]SQI54213.1 putative hydrolase [Lederbergia lenta]